MRKALFPRLASGLLTTSVLTSVSIAVFAESSVIVEPDLVDIRDVIPDVVLDIRYGFRLLQSALTYTESDHHG
ncbi:hypothetical protein ThimaDRAFT_4152 [Thiocapsa marina 5811]|uniref:Uncharacterized protein n=1 Tax=Thiocapsa marina 5811 TaxID=768671 RepID=F9UGU9_9GAMM|nr:hypothetical protein ThimaDRAFT_4152 [Thiocapsa marina 5811]